MKIGGRIMANEIAKAVLNTTSKILDKEIADAIRENDYETAIFGSIFNGFVKAAEKSYV
jgi:hypothetical protein